MSSSMSHNIIKIESLALACLFALFYILFASYSSPFFVVAFELHGDHLTAGMHALVFNVDQSFRES